MWDTVLTVIQPAMTGLGVFVAAGGGVVAIAYAIFRVFGEKWLSNKFEERLAAYKHAQQKELEQLRFEINTLMDRTVKFHQKEFDVIPEAWGLLNDAFNIVRPVSLGFQSYPDVNKLTDDQFAHLLDNSSFSDWEKSELKAASDKTRYYGNRLSFHKLADASACFNKFHDYFSRKSIFIPESIKYKFEAFDSLLYAALVEHQISLESREMGQQFAHGEELHKTGAVLLKSLEQDVRARLWNSQQAER